MTARDFRKLLLNGYPICMGDFVEVVADPAAKAQAAQDAAAASNDMDSKRRKFAA